MLNSVLQVYIFMKDKIEETKTFLLATSIVLLTIIFAVYAVVSFILVIAIFKPTEQEKLVIYIVLGVLLLFILTIYLFLGTGTVTFTKDRIIVKKWLFSHRRYFLYSKIEQINIFYGYIPIGFRRASGQSVSIFCKKMKNPVIHIEITYPLIAELMKHTEGIRIRVGYSSLLKFSKKHRALLWDYLRNSQKEEILRRLKKKQK